MEWILESISVNDISCLILSKRDPITPNPTVLILHGLGRHKEGMLPAMFAFARRGVRAVSFDLRLHGDRPGANSRDYLLTQDYFGGMSQIINGSTEDCSLILDSLGITSAGIHGLSLGGFCAFSAFAQDFRFAAAAVALGSPDWLAPLRQLGVDQKSEMWKLVAERSPLEIAESVYPPKPLLMMHGELDDTVPVEGVQKLFDKLQPYYAQYPERLQLKIYPELGHHYTDEMIEQSAAWLTSYF